MEFGEFLAVFCAVVVLPGIVFYNIRKMVEAKYSGKKSSRVKKGSGDALRMSELQAMIEIAVEDATAPLLRRIKSLEHQSDALLLEAHRPEEMISESDFAEEEAELVPANRS